MHDDAKRSADTGLERLACSAEEAPRMPGIHLATTRCRIRSGSFPTLGWWRATAGTSSVRRVSNAGVQTAVGSPAARRGSGRASPRRLLAPALLLVAACAEAHAASGTAESLRTASDLLGGAILVALVPAFVFGVRRRTLRRLQALMLATSREAEPAEVEVPEAPTVVEPVLTVYDGLGQLPGAVEAREQFVQRALSLFRKAMAVDALAALGYVALPFLFHAITGAENADDGTGVGSGLGALLLLLAALRYLFYRTQFRAVDAATRFEYVMTLVGNLILRFFVVAALLVRGTFINVEAIKRTLRYVVAPRAQVVYLTGWICFVVVAGLQGEDVGLVVAGLLHAGLVVGFIRSVQRIPGKRLLVLRVFGHDENAHFLFDGVLSFWRHFGHFFTVVDPAYWRHSNRVLSLGTLWFVALAFLSIGTGCGLYSLLSPQGDLTLLVAAGFSLPLLAGYAWVSERQMDRSFIRSKEHLNRLLSRFEKRPRRLDMTYKALETRCYDNTWKPAVAEFARRSDVVVMDLRGYSPERHGCQFEVNCLLDVVPVERIVFLLDKQIDRETARQLVIDAWKDIRITSPNRENPAPGVRFYVAATKDERDIQGVIDLLINAAAQGSRPSLLSATVPAASRGRARSWNARRGAATHRAQTAASRRSQSQ